MELERLIRYNSQTDIAEQEFARYKYTFLIINDNREMIRIKNKIFSELGPIVDYHEITSGNIPKSNGLQYSFFSFLTTKFGIEKPEKIYKSNKFKKDRNLADREEISLIKYLNSTFNLNV